MKIIHTSDWHLGQRFYRFDRNDEHAYFFKQLCNIIKDEQPDALVVSGDVFDNPAPTATVLTDFVKYVLDLHNAYPPCTIIITAGNHDSGTRLEVDKRLWQAQNVHVIGSCLRQDDGTFNAEQFVVETKDKAHNTNGYVIAAPYFHPLNYPAAKVGLDRENRQAAFYDSLLDKVNEKNEENLPVVMMAHLAVQGCSLKGHEDHLVGDMELSDLAVLGSGYDYLALGHIHKPQDIAEGNVSVRYSGSPIPLSFNEGYEHSVSIVELPAHKEKTSIRTIDIRPLRKMKSIPQQASTLEVALRELENLDSSDTSYIRLNIAPEEELPADAENRANALTKDKSCRFCEIHKEMRRNKTNDESRNMFLDVEEMQHIPPMQIAALHYAQSNGHELNDELSALLQQAIDEVNSGQISNE